MTALAEFADRLAEIGERHGAATRGPYFWWGNTDNHQAGLAGRGPCGVTEVITTVKVDRDPTGRDAAEIRSGMRECGYEPDDIEKYILDWAFDESASTRHDERLALSDSNGWLKAVEKLAVYQVARNQGLPDDTPRDHPKVYRADICDVRDNPNGDFLKHSWADIEWMSETLARVAALAVPKPAAVFDEAGNFCGLVTAPPDTHQTYKHRANCIRCSGWCTEAAPCECCWASVDPADLIEALTGRDPE